jgi:glycosyltransferase involved in cell wall biosynthesis
VTEKRLLTRRLIQIFNRYLEPGGEEAWVANLEKSFQLPTCYFNSSDWTGPTAPSQLGQALRMIYNPVSLEKLRQLHENEKAEAWIIQNAFPTGSAAIYREAERKQIPLIQYVHNFRPFALSYLQTSDLKRFPHRSRMYLKEIARGSWQNSRVNTAWFATVLTIAHWLRWFDAITAWIAVSDFMREQFIRAGVPSGKIFTLRHFWRPVADLSRKTDEEYYLFIGRLVEIKGVLVLLDVWDRIAREKSNVRPKLVIVGEGELEEKVRSRSKANPLIDFRGAVSKDEKHRLLSGMRALIAPSLCLESLGLVAYEAYDFSKPVLAARAGGLGEIVLHDRTGLLHEPGDVNALYEHVMILERDSGKRTQLGCNGHEWLLANADENAWRKKFAEIVEFAIASKRSATMPNERST